jgi:uncharacterized membrane protein
MKSPKFITILFTVLILLTAQAGAVFAAPALQAPSITGTITALECGTDIENPTVLVTLDAESISQTVEIDLASAVELGLISVNTDCSPDAFSEGTIGTDVVIDPAAVIPAEEESQHPVGAALSMFFSEITDYDTILAAHENGTGFGLLAQALWLTTKMEGDSDTFLAIVEAKKTKDFSAFVLEDGSTPQNWGQFKKAALNGDKKGNLGVVMSGQEKDKTNNGNGQDKDKNNNGNSQDKDKSNNGNKDKNKNKNK